MRTIRLDADSPRIAFHASMKNMTGHTAGMVDAVSVAVRYFQSSLVRRRLKQGERAALQRRFLDVHAREPSSSYLNRYHVRFGPAENPAVRVRDDDLLACITCTWLRNCGWTRRKAGWQWWTETRYAMVERFQYEPDKAYPGKASVIFWTNGPEIRLGREGIASLTSDPDAGPYYLEAELNSPMCRLRPGESCSFETEWFPTRAGSEFHGATEAGIVIQTSSSKRSAANGKVKLIRFIWSLLIAGVWSRTCTMSTDAA